MKNYLGKKTYFFSSIINHAGDLSENLRDSTHFTTLIIHIYTGKSYVYSNDFSFCHMTRTMRTRFSNVTIILISNNSNLLINSF